MRPKRRELLGSWIRGWLPKESVAPSPQEAKPLSNTDILVMRILVPPALVLAAWATAAFIYSRQFVEAILYLLYIGFILVLLLHRTRSIKNTMRRVQT
jgi:hypothetical protein